MRIALVLLAGVVLAGCQGQFAPVRSTPSVTVRPTVSVPDSPPTYTTPLPSPSPTTTSQPTPAITKRPTATPKFGEAPTGPTEEATVIRVVDGDTIHVLLDGEDHSLRYIGMDTPETVNPNQPVEWMGREASDANKRLVDGQEVVLEKDVSETDRYGRLLRYVWLHDARGWLLVNGELVRLGYAQVFTYPPDVKYNELFLELERDARDAGRGLWSESPVDSSPPTATEPPGGSAGNCDPSYPGVCIPPPPPDLDCGDIPYRRFTVLPPDPHRFDGDQDGIGCES
jgi:micrococcal nuclease